MCDKEILPCRLEGEGDLEREGDDVPGGAWRGSGSSRRWTRDAPPGEEPVGGPGSDICQSRWSSASFPGPGECAWGLVTHLPNKMALSSPGLPGRFLACFILLE